VSLSLYNPYACKKTAKYQRIKHSYSAKLIKTINIFLTLAEVGQLPINDHGSSSSQFFGFLSDPATVKRNAPNKRTHQYYTN
jgi:hypothetical protein